MLKLQIGAGLDGPAGWMNVDASPVLRLQRLPVVGSLFRRMVKPEFSPRVSHGNVVRGLALPSGIAALVYSSHMLEHLALRDLELALAEIYRVLLPGGTFRSVLPDLEYEATRYLQSQSPDRASEFMQATLLGVESREVGVMSTLRGWFGNSAHKWMWDYPSIAARLGAAGFVDIRRAVLGDSSHAEFDAVENPERWHNCLGFECRKSG
ncbi:MAG: methyltransferase domain-containing protein [Frankiaceae bacterium]|nr:methyltransferase domain-containing protein [Arenimonas sp.]